MLDETPFIAKAEETCGEPLLASAKTRRKEPGSFGKSGLLCVFEGSLAFVEEKLLDPGEVVVVPREAISAARLESRSFDSILHVEHGGRTDQFVDMKPEQAAAVLEALGLGDPQTDAAPEPLAPAPPDVEPEDLDPPAEPEAAPEPLAPAPPPGLEPQELDPLAETAPPPEDPGSPDLAAYGLEPGTQITIHWKVESFTISAEELLAGIQDSRFGKGTRFQVMGSDEPIRQLGEEAIYLENRPSPEELQRRRYEEKQRRKQEHVAAQDDEKDEPGCGTCATMCVLGGIGFSVHWALGLVLFCAGFVISAFVSGLFRAATPTDEEDVDSEP